MFIIWRVPAEIRFHSLLTYFIPANETHGW